MKFFEISNIGEVYLNDIIAILNKGNLNQAQRTFFERELDMEKGWLSNLKSAHIIRGGNPDFPDDHETAYCSECAIGFDHDDHSGCVGAGGAGFCETNY